jgi:hypothetical protein
MLVSMIENCSISSSSYPDAPSYEHDNLHEERPKQLLFQVLQDLEGMGGWSDLLL